MKKLFFVLSLFVSITVLKANPNFTVGSNPYFTVFGFPHDLLKWPKKAVFGYIYPQTLPWQGNVTDINERPNDTYVSNYNSFEFSVPDGYTGDPNAIRSYMKTSGYAYNDRYSFGGIWDFNEYGRVYLELGTVRVNLELETEGIVRNDNTLELIPVIAHTNASRSYYDVQCIYANYLFGNPIGFKIQYQDKNTDAPDSQIKFNRRGTEVVSNHLLWGWTTTGCSHIFRNPNEEFSQNFDAWFLNDYTLYQGYQLDLQLSYEYGSHKSGIRYRRNGESGRNYYWRSNLTETEPGANFNGQYITDPRYEDEIANDMIRAYSKIRFWKIGDVDMGLLFFVQYADHETNTISTNRDSDSEPLSSDLENEVTIEINPWLNYKFGKSYFDFGILCEFSYTTMENVSPRWNNATGATQKDVVRNSSPYDGGFSPSWESYSQGNYFFFATGVEASMSINLTGRLSALGSLLLMRKYSFITKEYGRSEIAAGSSSYGFNVSHTRDDYKNETWMTGSIGIAYGFGPVQTIAVMQLPLAYLLEKNTELSDGKSKLVDLTQRNVWAVQEPVNFRLLLVFGLER
ncbi:MAG: hypothetical protein JXA06_04195 [Bacteroidetes bacterium]|nr:hypothetical protein [Bacteroidota bacterium]